MTDAEFNRQMSRLASAYPQGSYPKERIFLISEAVGTLTESAWRRMVDQLIGECERAPMLPKIREMAAAERERAWASEKQQHADESKAGWTRLSRGELKTVFDTIRSRMSGGVSDDDFRNFTQAIEGIESSDSSLEGA